AAAGDSRSGPRCQRRSRAGDAGRQVERGRVSVNTLWAASVRHLLRHPAQLALALLGLALGVATIIAVDIATASSGRAFELSMEAVSGAATHEIRGGPGGIDERLYVRLKTAGAPIDLAPVVD